jgi:uncharacterized protein (TIRG00374 family)
MKFSQTNMLRVIKIAVSTFLIAILVWNIEWSDFLSEFRGMSPGLTITAVVLLWVQYPLSAWKWRKSLRLHGMQYQVSYLLRVHCIGFFFNSFLPTAIGGDAYRAFRTMDKADRKAYAISAIVAERILGLLALVFLGYFSAIYLVYQGLLLHRGLVTLALALVAVAALGVCIAWRLGFHEWFWGKLQRQSRLEPLVDSVRVISANRRHFSGLVGLSLLFQGVAILTIAVLFAAVDLPGRLFESGFSAAAAGVASMLPISINGIGVMESSFVVAGMEAQLPYAKSVLVALFLRAFMVVASIVFGILYALEPSERRVPDESPIK